MCFAPIYYYLFIICTQNTDCILSITCILISMHAYIVIIIMVMHVLWLISTCRKCVPPRQISTKAEIWWGIYFHSKWSIWLGVTNAKQQSVYHCHTGFPAAHNWHWAASCLRRDSSPGYIHSCSHTHSHVKIKTLQSHACISQIQQLILLLILNPACKLCVSICSHNILHNLIVLENQFCHKIIFTDMFGTIIQARMHCMGPCI